MRQCKVDMFNMRSIPGVLILDSDYSLLFANNEAFDIVPEIWIGDADGSLPLPQQIINLCDSLKTNIQPSACIHRAVSGSTILQPATELPYCIRAFFIRPPKEREGPRHIMVLLERIADKREIDLVQVKKEYGFSKREVEVLRCVCQGLTNREIAEATFISEHTVKGHLKKIMRRMGIHSRSEIVATLR